MRIINRSHKHIKHETLSEYLDGRIQGSALTRIDQQLAGCPSCQEGLASLRSIVTMLRELPQEAPRRSFVMTAPPPMSAPATNPAFRLPNLLRVPQWAYAGAASVAVIVFVALISADASGLLSTGGVSQFQAQPAPVTQEIETLASRSGTQTRATATEDRELGGAAATQPTPARDGDTQAAPAATAAPAASTASAAPEQSLAAAPVQQFQSAQIEKAVPAEETADTLALAAEAPLERTAAAAPAQEPSPEQAVTALGPKGSAGVSSDDAVPKPVTPASADLDVDKVPTTTPVSTGAPLPPNEGVAAIWRVLEGIAAFFGLIFLVALGLRWRMSHKTGNG